MRLFGHLLAPQDRGLAVVDVQGDRISDIRPTSTPPPGAIGGPDSWVVPGLIDAQVNGAFGQDFSDPSADVGLVRRRLPEFGVTGFVPTIVTSPGNAYGPCLNNLSEPWGEEGSRVLGVHLEGPFLSSSQRGTHTAAWLRDPDPVEARRWLSYGNVRIVTVAPEQPGAEALIRMLVGAGVVVSMGHSAATWAEAAAGAAWGATYGTHLFNAMPPLHHRAPGLAGFLLGSRLPVGLIGDGVHVALDMIRLIARIKGPDEVVLITDALAGLGMRTGRYELAGTEFVSDGVVGRQVDGTLSGSLLPLNLAVRNLIDAGIPASTALGFVTANPSRLLGLGHLAGRIVVGATADVVVLDSGWNVEATVIGGALAYVRGERPGRPKPRSRFGVGWSCGGRDGRGQRPALVPPRGAMTHQGHTPDVPTLMRAEISEIPDVVRRLVIDEVEQFSAVVARVRAASPRLVIIAARGTSDHAGIYSKYLFEATLGLPAALAAASLTTIYDQSPRWNDALVLSLSQSGASPDIVAVTEAARAGGAVTVAITNDPGSPLARAAEFSIACGAGPERAVAATKSYVAELAAIAALVARLSGEERLIGELDRLPEHLVAVLATAERWLAEHDSIIGELAAANRMLVISRGFNLPTALEVALKFKETSGIFAEGYSSADLLHGPVALALPGVPVVVFRPNGPMGSSMDAVVERMVSGGSALWLVGGSEVAAATVPVRWRLVLPDVLPETLTPLGFVIPGYLLAGSVALRRGMDPDAPRGLSKITRTT